MTKKIKLQRNEETVPGVNCLAEVEESDLENWLKTGKWEVVDGKEPVLDIPKTNEVVKTNGNVGKNKR